MLHHYTRHTPIVQINAHEILENHTLALCNDQLTHMVPIPPAEPPEINAFITTARLTFF